MGTMLREKLTILTLALSLVALAPVDSQAKIADDATVTGAERGTRTGLQPATVLSWGDVSTMRSGR